MSVFNVNGHAIVVSESNNCMSYQSGEGALAFSSVAAAFRKKPKKQNEINFKSVVANICFIHSLIAPPNYS